jgi:hypothetical protein
MRGGRGKLITVRMVDGRMVEATPAIGAGLGRRVQTLPGKLRRNHDMDVPPGAAREHKAGIGMAPADAFRWK